MVVNYAQFSCLIFSDDRICNSWNSGDENDEIVDQEHVEEDFDGWIQFFEEGV